MPTDASRAQALARILILRRPTVSSRLAGASSRWTMANLLKIDGGPIAQHQPCKKAQPERHRLKLGLVEHDEISNVVFRSSWVVWRVGCR